MANLTLNIDDDLLRRARIKALESGTSVNAIVREYLEHFAGGTRTRSAVTSFLVRSPGSMASSGATGRMWTRDELYDP